MSDENSLIDWIQVTFADIHARSPSLRIGIGDDAAHWVDDSTLGELVSTDTILDGVHFDARLHAPEMIGRKALAVSLSDIAAMAGQPSYVTVNLILPRRCDIDFVKKLMLGMHPLCLKYQCALAGGDVTSWGGPLAITTTVRAAVHERGIPRRDRAQAGDAIFVSGQLGNSLKSGRHLSFEPRVEAAQVLMTEIEVNAMMDLSDGLATDLRRLCKASHLGAEIYPESLPRSRGLSTSDWPTCLTDGEDFELLFTANVRYLQSIEALTLPECVRLTRVGTMLAEPGLRLRFEDGRTEALEVKGYLHAFGTDC